MSFGLLQEGNELDCSTDVFHLVTHSRHPVFIDRTPLRVRDDRVMSTWAPSEVQPGVDSASV
jgi:hypothetical protein